MKISSAFSPYTLVSFYHWEYLVQFPMRGLQQIYTLITEFSIAKWNVKNKQIIHHIISRW